MKMRMEGMRKCFCSTPIHCTYTSALCTRQRMEIVFKTNCMVVKIYTTRIRLRCLSMYSIQRLLWKRIYIRKAANKPLINGHAKKKQTKRKRLCLVLLWRNSMKILHTIQCTATQMHNTYIDTSSFSVHIHYPSFFLHIECTFHWGARLKTASIPS